MGWHVTAWWIAAGALLAAEAFTGTFYLCMLAIACAAAGVVHWLGAGFAIQCLAFAFFSLALTGLLAACTGRRVSMGLRRRGAANRAMMDVGARVEITRWQPGQTRVRYRGAYWNVSLVAGAPVSAGWHRVVGIDGITLIVEPETPPDFASEPPRGGTPPDVVELVDHPTAASAATPGSLPHASVGEPKETH